jgi:Kdo2-lipid A phosphotransferase
MDAQHISEQGNTGHIGSWLILHLTALLLLATFFLGYWDGVDRDAFEVFNHWLLLSGAWAEFVAIANQRWVDFVAGSVMLLTLGHFAWRSKPSKRLRVFAAAILMGTTFSAAVAAGDFMPKRLSPSLSHEHAVRVTEQFPHIRTKDASKASLPSDHAIGFFTFLLFAFYRFASRALWLVAPLIALLAMPRLLVGAHWLTDYLCGALPLILIAGAWVFHSNAGIKLEQLLEQGLAWTLKGLGFSHKKRLA